MALLGFEVVDDAVDDADAGVVSSVGGGVESEDPQALRTSVVAATAGTIRETRFTRSSVPYVSLFGRNPW